MFCFPHPTEEWAGLLAKTLLFHSRICMSKSSAMPVELAKNTKDTVVGAPLQCRMALLHCRFYFESSKYLRFAQNTYT